MGVLKVREAQVEDEIERPKTVTVTVGVLGSNVSIVDIPAGTTQGEFLSSHEIAKAKKLGSIEVRINGKREDQTYVLQSGDEIYGLPKAIQGGFVISTT